MSVALLQRLFSLEGKAALVTGASGGIGRALAVALAGAGAVVGVHGRDAARVAESCRAVAEAGGRALPLGGDVATVDGCRRLITEMGQAAGRLDILVNCAGANRRKPIVEVSEEDFDTLLAVNLRSVYFLSQAAHPLLCAQGGGKIIHIGSINTFYGLDNVSVYGAGKGGVAQLAKVMAVEWAKDNIQVNCLTPGFIRTPLTESVWADERRAAWLLNRLPSRRGGLPEDLVGATLLLASPASDYITGQNIVVDGGFLAGGSWLRDGA